MVLIPSWEQPVAGNLSDKLGAFWELVIGSDASARSLGIGWEIGSPKISLGALKLQKGARACQLRLGPRKTTTGESRPTEQAIGACESRTREFQRNVAYYPLDQPKPP